jgi:biopolymer transport protein ExbB
MKYLSILLICLSAAVFAEEEKQQEKPKNIQHLEDLLQQVKSSTNQQKQIQKDRESAFKQDLSEVRNQLKQAKRELATVKSETKRLKNTFEDNEEALSDLEEELRKSLGNLGEMFGVVRQVAQDISSIRDASLLRVELGHESEVLDRLSESKALPSISELEQLWYEMQLHMTKQGEVKRFDGKYINNEGQTIEATLAHIGPFAALNEEGYLTFDSETGYLLSLPNQPSVSFSAEDYFSDTANMSEISLDPTRGTLLTLGSQSPSYMDRIHQGGVIGYIILLLAASGILYGLYLLIERLKMSGAVGKQLNDIENPSPENPLGRVLSVYADEKDEQDLETLEMKLDEAVLKELPQIEKGLPLIKLLAAVAPLLGLLGTVTGMIATFQSITLFGTGDPKLMAGGISQALITTVLGLVAAIPLLFMHNIVNGRSKRLIQILDQQSAGLIAQQAQKN